MPPLKRSTQHTGPVEEVTPWDLAPGPEGDGDRSVPPSPSRSKHSSKVKSNVDSNFPVRSVAPPDLYRGVGIQPAPARAPKISRKSTSQASVKSQESRQSFGQAQVSAKSSRSGSKGKGRKESKPLVGMGMAERTRQLPLTGPLEEVAPWEMHTAPEIEVADEAEGDTKILVGNRARSRSSLTGKANRHTREDEPSINSARSSSKGPFSARKTGGEKRDRTNSAAASWDGRLSGEVGETLRGNLSSVNHTGSGKEVDEEPVVGNGRIATNHPANLKSTASARAPAPRAIPMVSSLSLSLMEEVTPWEMYPVLPSHQQSASSRYKAKDQILVRISYICFFFDSRFSTSIFFGSH